jgi:hypothetical protein
MRSLDRRKQYSIFTAMMFAECAAESTAMQQKVAADRW